MNPNPPSEAEIADMSLAGQFLDALAHRDFTAVAACFEPDVRFRALVPPGPFEMTGPVASVARLRTWFGGDDGFEVLDASIGQVGARLYLRWRVRMRSAADPSAARLVEQHAFATVRARIESLDLLCSGFQTEQAVVGWPLPAMAAS